jgi:hypothetical protein
MTLPDDYGLQIDAGKAVVRAILRDLSTALADPRLSELEFVEMTGDFDNDCLSLVDRSTGEIVTRLKIMHLADAPATPSRRRQLQEQIRLAVIAPTRKRMIK